MTRTASVGLVVGLAFLLAVAPVTGADIYAVDHDHSLTTDDAIATYEEKGVATGQVYTLDMSLTVADKAEDVGLSEWKHSSAGATYFQIEYNEEIKRTVRIYIPSEFWSPRLKQGLEAVNNDVTADLEPGDNGNYTVVTVTLSEPTNAVFRMPWHRGQIADTRSRLGELVNESTGWSLPSIAGGGDEWEYVAEGKLSTNATHPLKTNGSQYTIQYDADGSPNSQQWITVRNCNNTDNAPVCTFQKQGEENYTYLLSTASTPPQVRFKKGPSSVSSLQSSINDIQKAVDNLLKDVKSWLPSNSSGGGS